MILDGAGDHRVQIQSPRIEALYKRRTSVLLITLANRPAELYRWQRGRWREKGRKSFASLESMRRYDVRVWNESRKRERAMYPPRPTA
jgi:hypothetical protein